MVLHSLPRQLRYRVHTPTHSHPYGTSSVVVSFVVVALVYSLFRLCDSVAEARIHAEPPTLVFPHLNANVRRGEPMKGTHHSCCAIFRTTYAFCVAFVLDLRFNAAPQPTHLITHDRWRDTDACRVGDDARRGG